MSFSATCTRTRAPQSTPGTFPLQRRCYLWRSEGRRGNALGWVEVFTSSDILPGRRKKLETDHAVDWKFSAETKFLIVYKYPGRRFSLGEGLRTRRGRRAMPRRQELTGHRCSTRDKRMTA